MNNDNLSPLTTFVTIQGPRVLRLIESQNNFALFDVVGFENQVFIQDFRYNSIKATFDLEKNNNASKFAHKFNAPAHLTLKTQPDNTLLIILEDTPIEQPENMLWIAIGLEDDLPLYNYLFEYILPFENDTLAIVAIYRRPSTAYQLSEDVSDVTAFPRSFIKSRYKSSSDLRDLRISSGPY